MRLFDQNITQDITNWLTVISWVIHSFSIRDRYNSYNELKEELDKRAINGKVSAEESEDDVHHIVFAYGLRRKLRLIFFILLELLEAVLRMTYRRFFLFDIYS